MSDDSALRPSAPLLQAIEPEEQDAIASQLDRQTADAYFHPAWARVEEMLMEAIDVCELPVDPKLPSDEYKVESLSNMKTKAILNGVIQRVKDAVSAVEQSEPKRKSGRSKGGN